MTETVATPTEADFTAATSYLERFYAETDDSFWTLEERAIAQALADQRARYEAIADQRVTEGERRVLDYLTTDATRLARTRRNRPVSAYLLDLVRDFETRAALDGPL